MDSSLVDVCTAITTYPNIKPGEIFKVILRWVAFASKKGNESSQCDLVNRCPHNMRKTSKHSHTHTCMNTRAPLLPYGKSHFPSVFALLKLLGHWSSMNEELSNQHNSCACCCAEVRHAGIGTVCILHCIRDSIYIGWDQSP